MFSSADLKSGMSCGQPRVIFAVERCAAAACACEIKARLKCIYIYYILLVNYEVLLYSVKEKTNSIEPSGTGIMLQLVEGSLTCS